MLSDEEKHAIEFVKSELQDEKIARNDYQSLTGLYGNLEIETVLNLIEKQSKEIEELSDKLTQRICKGVEEEILEEYRQTIISKDKEIEELKEDKYGLEEEVQIQAKNLMLYENVLSEIQDKIKAKIEEYKEKCKNCNFRGKICKEFKQNYNCTIAMCLKEFYSLLEKE